MATAVTSTENLLTHPCFEASLQNSLLSGIFDDDMFFFATLFSPFKVGLPAVSSIAFYLVNVPIKTGSMGSLHTSFTSTAYFSPVYGWLHCTRGDLRCCIKIHITLYVFTLLLLERISLHAAIKRAYLFLSKTL